MVDFLVRALDYHCNSNFEGIANPQKRRHRNRTTSFDLLPMASGESKSNHILLAVAASLAEFLDPLAKGFEESGVIYHAGLLLLPDQKHHEQISCLRVLVPGHSFALRLMPYSQLAARLNRFNVVPFPFRC